MVNEANQILTHTAAAVTVAAAWRKQYPVVRREVVLPNAKRADVVANAREGSFYICEVKHALKSSLIEEAIAKYGRWCNYLYFAVAGATAADVERHVKISDMPMPWHRVGILGVYPGTITVLRTAAYRQVGRFDSADLRTILADHTGW